MNALRIVVRLVLAWIALLAAQIVVGIVVHPKTPANPHPMLFLMVSNAVIVLGLGWAALRSDWRDWRLLIALFFVSAVIAFANWIEGALYLTNVGIEWRGFIVYEVLTAAVAALLWLLVFRGAPVPESSNDHPLPHRSFPQMLWRFVLCSAVYVCLYFLAGTIIFPFVRDYYATQHIPSPGADHCSADPIARASVHPGVPDAAADVPAASPVGSGSGRTGVYLYQRGRGADYAERNLPGYRALGAFLGSFDLELRVWDGGGLGMGAGPES